MNENVYWQAQWIISQTEASRRYLEGMQNTLDPLTGDVLDVLLQIENPASD